MSITSLNATKLAMLVSCAKLCLFTTLVCFCYVCFVATRRRTPMSKSLGPTKKMIMSKPDVRLHAQETDSKKRKKKVSDEFKEIFVKRIYGLSAGSLNSVGRGILTENCVCVLK